ncbi:TSUP family transporter [Streptomyces violaceoruber]|uniref:TSUP family transporter n=1 Tax=Streptomyces violaceoruber TaxID=1935 RepID=UPI00403CB923
MDDLVLAGIVLFGASLQWMTGMGFALVAVPPLVLLLGPSEGVVLTNCASGIICLAGLAQGWRRVRVGAMVPLCTAAICTVPIGARLTATLPEPVLMTVMGALVTAAVLLVMYGARVPALRGRKGAVAAGGLGGLMNSAAGVGGPPISLYAINAGWTVREFVPNAFFYGVVVNIFSVAAHGPPHLDAERWVWVAGAPTIGMMIGRTFSGRLPENRARWLVLALALAGGMLALGKGLWRL